MPARQTGFSELVSSLAILGVISGKICDAKQVYLVSTTVSQRVWVKVRLLHMLSPSSMAARLSTVLPVVGNAV